VVLVAFDDLDVRILLQARDVLRRGIEHEVDLAREERGDARGILLDRQVDDLVDVALVPAPPVGVLHHHGLHVGVAALEDVRPRAVGVARGEGLLLAGEILGLEHVVLGRPRLAHHADLGEPGDQHRRGAVGDDVHGEVVDLLHFLDVADVGAEARGLHLRTGDGEHDVVGGEGRAVVELHVGAQLETHHRRAHALP
jgi:hypothetical protein